MLRTLRIANREQNKHAPVSPLDSHCVTPSGRPGLSFGAWCELYGPKLIPHSWHDVGATPGKMLVVVQPAGNIDAFSEDLEKLSAGENRNDPGAFRALFEKHDMDIIGPPLPKKLVG